MRNICGQEDRKEYSLCQPFLVIYYIIRKIIIDYEITKSNRIQSLINNIKIYNIFYIH